MKTPILAILLVAAMVLPCLAKPFDQTLDGSGFSVRIKSPNICLSRNSYPEVGMRSR